MAKSKKKLTKDILKKFSSEELLIIYHLIKKYFLPLIDKLEPRYREIIKLKLEEDFSNFKVGNIFGITQERVRQIYKKALIELDNIKNGQN